MNKYILRGGIIGGVWNLLGFINSVNILPSFLAPIEQFLNFPSFLTSELFELFIPHMGDNPSLYEFIFGLSLLFIAPIVIGASIGYLYSKFKNNN